MRIVGGQFSGRKIIAPKGMIARPTTDRVREALFNILSHHEDISIDGARIIDLFAGSGALGLESLSRGARFCLFVERDSTARGAIRDNIEALSLYGQTKIQRRSATALGALPTNIGGSFSLAFMDPPYRMELVLPTLEGLAHGGWLDEGAYVIAEMAKEDAIPVVEHYTELDMRIYGDSKIVFFRYSEDQARGEQREELRAVEKTVS